jgi:hypothetical protein
VEYLDQRPGAVGRTQTVNADCGGVASGYQTAQLSCSASTTLTDLANFVTQPRAVPAQISLVDPDLALSNPAFVNVTVRNSQGDSETIRLDLQGAGRYAANSLPMTRSAPTPGNGNLGFTQPASITVDYSDATTPAGSPQNVAQSCGNVTPGFTLAQLTASFPTIDARAPSALSTGNAAIATSCNITLTDPDLSGAAVNVSLRAVNGQTGQVDTESLTLSRVSPGVYSRSTCQVEGFIYAPSNVALITNPIPNNGIINLGGGATTISVSFTDNTPPNGGSQVVSRSLTVNN